MERMTIRESVKALGAYRFTPREEPIKLDQNESALDAPIELKQRVGDALAALPWNRYPGGAAGELERRLAERHGWDPDGVVVANGSNVLIQALTIAAGLGRRVVTVAPTFAVYAQQARLLDAELVEVPLGERFELPLDALERAVAGHRGVLFLPNPAAPTGNLHPEAELERLLAASAGMLSVIDEAYGEFSGTDHAELVRRHPHAVSLRTFSKALGLAGVRVGYLLAAPALATEVRKALLPFSFSALQAAIASALLDERDLLTERVAAVTAERERVAAGLAELPGVRVFQSVTNFILFRVADAAGLYVALLRQGVVVRRQDHLPGATGCLRVTVGSAADNDAFLAAAAASLGASGSGRSGLPHRGTAEEKPAANAAAAHRGEGER